MSNPRVLDVCCGSRMFWFDKNNPEARFIDRRKEKHVLCDNRKLEIKPDIVADFTDLPFESRSFSLVVFDPPHLEKAGDKSWMCLKYGRLENGWEEEIKKGFAECFRVLKTDGILIFKWNETQVPVSKVLALAGVPPLFGNRCGKTNKTHWIVFIKPNEEEPNDSTTD